MLTLEIAEHVRCVGITIVSGQVTFSSIGDTKSCPHKPWSEAQTKARQQTATIEFDVPFYETPAVFLSLSQLDMSNGYNARYWYQVEEVSPTGMAIKFGVWCNTYVYSARIDYYVTG